MRHCGSCYIICDLFLRVWNYKTVVIHNEAEWVALGAIEANFSGVPSHTSRGVATNFFKGGGESQKRSFKISKLKAQIPKSLPGYTPVC